MVINILSPGDMAVTKAYLESRPEARVGITSGCFDIFHFPHQNYLLQCRRLCDILIVGVDSDPMVRTAKGEGRPIIPDFRRAMIVSGQETVDIAFVMHSLNSFKNVVREFRVDTIFRNDQFAGIEDTVAGAGVGTGNGLCGAEVLIIPDSDILDSTTEIIDGIVAHQRRDEE